MSRPFSPERILLIQLRRIGDVLMTTPAVRALREAYPEARIVYLTEPPADQIFRNSPHVDEVWSFPLKAGVRQRWAMVQRLKSQRFDLAIDFHSHPRTALISRVSGAPRRIGLDLRGRRWAYTDPVQLPEGRHYAAVHKGALLGPLGLELGSILPEVHLGTEERAYAERLLGGLGVEPEDFLVALLPVSRQPYKVWPVDRYARLADWLVERHGAKVLLLWGPGEESFVRQLRAAMQHEALPDYPVPSLLELAALLERADLYVGNDAGPRHFAIAVGTPSVGVFGKPHPENWTPPGSPIHHTVSYDPGCKDACTYPRCSHLNCINGVSFEAVQEATGQAIEDIRHGRLS